MLIIYVTHEIKSNRFYLGKIVYEKEKTDKIDVIKSMI